MKIYMFLIVNYTIKNFFVIESNMLSHLKEKYGYNKFRSQQENVITDIMKKENVIVVFPTGAGKSLCYQFPATYLGKCSLVISPLISLMEDQQLHLEKRGIKSICLCSVSEKIGNLSLFKRSADEDDFLRDYNVIYTTPEYFVGHLETFRKLSRNLCMIAIDEAHCLSAWGHDFRSSYKELSIIRSEFVDIPVMLLTATATPTVLEDIFETLDIDAANQYNLGTRRDNLIITVLQKRNLVDDLKIIDPLQSTIIYVQTRKKAEEVCLQMNKIGMKAEFYHAGISTEERTEIHRNFVKDKTKVLVATIAYGMGIDKPDIRLIINWGAPCDIATYYQMIGRCGRDGLLGKVVLFHDKSDFATNKFLISKSNQVEYRTAQLNIFKEYIENDEICRQVLIDNYFVHENITKETKNVIKCKICDNCTRDFSAETKIDAVNEVLCILKLVESSRVKYGIKKLIDVLRGRVKTSLGSLVDNKYFGSCRHVIEEHLKKIIQKLITEQYLQEKPYKFYSVIDIGDKEFSEVSFEVRVKPDRSTSMPSLRNNTYLQTLESRRQKLALENDTPTYMIVNDKVLQQIAVKKPSSLEELLLIDGVSTNFIATYGVNFLTSASDDKENEVKILSERSPSDTICESVRMFMDGKSVFEISKIRNLKPMTIESHIIDFYAYYPDKIDEKKFAITDSVVQEVSDAVKKLGKERLKPIKEEVSAQISYLQIKICLIKYV